jgi:hypothetical protein
MIIPSRRAENPSSTTWSFTASLAEANFAQPR